jgi:hypothetical protein
LFSLSLAFSIAGLAQADTDLPSEQGAAAPVGAAQWLVQTIFVASSLETGRVGYVEAWGGDEFGRAYV